VNPQAREILVAYQAGTLEHDLIAQEAAAADNCPSCGATTLHRSIPLKQRALVLATFLLASAPFPTRESQIQCRSCGHRWSYGTNGSFESSPLRGSADSGVGPRG
jgi:hypothetical protein